MAANGLLPVNFVLARAAREAAEALRREYDQRFPHDPAGVLAIGWGYVDGTDPRVGRAVVMFYPRSQLAEMTPAIQEVSGVKFVFFTTPTFHELFAGKILDHDAGRGFYLR